eukprot:5798121-Pleurochrysis_carterae.AAC.1
MAPLNRRLSLRCMPTGSSASPMASTMCAIIRRKAFRTALVHAVALPCTSVLFYLTLTCTFILSQATVYLSADDVLDEVSTLM